jgi:hypothetical protein
MSVTTQTFRQAVQFGITNGPTFGGVNTVTNTSADTPRLYSSLCLHGVNTTIDASGFVYDNWLAMGFSASADATQTGTPTSSQLSSASVTVSLTDALTGGATPYLIPLGMGQASSWVTIPATILHNCSNIAVVGDANVDVDVYGILLLTA